MTIRLIVQTRQLRENPLGSHLGQPERKTLSYEEECITITTIFLSLIIGVVPIDPDLKVWNLSSSSVPEWVPSVMCLNITIGILH